MSSQTNNYRTLSLSYLKDGGSGQETQGKFASNRIVTSRYTIVTFVPRNLFEQFRRMVNFFFVCLIIIQVSIDIPVNPIAYSAAFIFVIAVTGVKQGYEDWCRHRADNKVNFATANVLASRTGSVSSIQSKDIHVGQILKVGENEDVLCDLLLIACESKSGEVQSFCQITTANLDGESNLKMRSCPSNFNIQMKAKDDNSTAAIEKLSGYTLKYDNPDSNLYKLNGEMNCSSETIPFTMENCILRGSQVKNCGCIYGIVIYTGKETRLSMNSNKPKTSKFSTIERTMNKIVIGMFVVLITLASSSVGLSFLYKNSTFDKMWYLPQDESDSKHGITIFFSYLVLLCYLIPVSLSVTFELQKLGCSKFFPWDREMTCDKTGTKPLCNTSDLNEELGQIQYLFTDKTGTLTDNELVLCYCSVQGVKYRYSDEEGSLCEISDADDLNNNDGSKILIKPPYRGELGKFLEVLALCHTVKVLQQSGDLNHNQEPQYQSGSLDEEILVKAAYRLGTKFLGESDDQVHVEGQEQKESFTRLSILEFDSDRKCMSVILRRNSSNEVVLFCKGAESSVLPNCESVHADLVKTINNDVLEFAKLGLRTMVMAYRNLSEEETDSFLKNQQAVKDSPAELTSLFRSIECNLIPLGCTGVEDKLQEGVSETLEALQEAGIRVLMLTGDKLETAVSIATSCGLLKVSEAEQNKEFDNIAVISEESDVESVEQKLEKIREDMSQGKSKSLVMDGPSFAMAVERYKRTLAFIMIHAASVIFCRMAPLQKSQAVSLLKNNRGKVLKTCAVGDGGNDCAMLREAHLGIGIIGKEGLQAARESDFAVARFRFLQKAILVHGYWYYYRLASLITYFFYRGVVFIFLIFLYGFDNGFSATTIFDSSFVMMFTIAFTSVPVLVQGLTDQSLSKEELLVDPSTYKTLRDNKMLSLSRTWRWFLIGAWHIVLCYYVPRFVWLEALSGFHDYGAFSLFVSTCVVITSDLKVLVEASYFTWPTLVVQVMSYFAMLGFYSIICQIGTNSSGLLSFAYYPLLQQTEFWLSVLLIGILSVIPDLVLFYFNIGRRYYKSQ